MCIAFAFPERRGEGYNLNKLVPAALLKEDLAVLTRLVEDASRSPQIDSAVNLDDEFAAVVERVSAQVLNAAGILAEPAKHLNDPAVCTTLIAFHTDILNLPPQRSGRLLRAIADPER